MFRIRLRNHGTKDATDLVVTAHLSRNLEFLRGGGISQKSTLIIDPREHTLTFQRIDKVGPGEEVVVGFVGKVTSPFPTLATCRVSATHKDLPKGEKLEDTATVKVTNKSVFQ